MSVKQIILASASPRRHELLRQLAVDFSVASQDVDESQNVNESPLDYVRRMSDAKADSALARLLDNNDSVILAADTIVLCAQEVMGKPVDQADAVRMLLKLAGRDHQVLSAVTVATCSRREFALSQSTVSFRPISPEEAERYWHSGEPVGKAGAYGIQGRAAVFVNRLSGSYSGVMGLPLFETANLLEKFGIDCMCPESVGAELES